MKRLTESEKRMLRSCYAYGCTGINGNQYVDPIADRVGLKTVLAYFEELAENYTVSYNVATDSEGVTYNSLIKN